jgi:hypothetical protein
MLNQETSQTISTGYDSSMDPLLDLQNSCQITEINSSLSHLVNGIAYSFVEVTWNDGIQYGLQAYGNEALALKSSFTSSQKYLDEIRPVTRAICLCQVSGYISKKQRFIQSILVCSKVTLRSRIANRVRCRA